MVRGKGMCLGSEGRVMSAQPLVINQFLHEAQQYDSKACAYAQHVSFKCI